MTRLIPAILLLVLAACTTGEIDNANSNFNRIDLQKACNQLTDEKRSMDAQIDADENAYSTPAMIEAIGVFEEGDRLCGPPYDNLEGRAAAVRENIHCIGKIKENGTCLVLY